MRSLLVLLCSTTLLAACAAGDRATDDAAFVTQAGDDTVAVERFMRTSDGFRAEVALRVPRTSLRVYNVRFDDTGAPVGMTIETYDPANGLAGDPVETEEMDLTTGSGIPFIDMVHWPYELMLRRASQEAEDSMTVELVTRRRPLPFVVKRLSPEHYTTAHPTRGVMDVTTDADGRLLTLDASKTTRALRVTRQQTIDVSALAKEFAARDARGESMGALSGRGEVKVTVGGAEFHIDYGRPSKRGREIFGALVPFGKVWRTGADRATHFTTSHDLVIGDETLPAGSYTLFSIPGPETWTLIVNSRTGINGQAYDAESDLMHLTMQTRALEETVETFTILVEEGDEGGVLKLQWDRTEAYLPFRIVL